MHCSRRQFLKNTVLAAAGIVCSSPFARFASASAPAAHSLITGTSNSVRAIDLATRDVHTVPVDLTPHGFVQSPGRPERFWVVEKYGEHAAEVDFRERRVVRQLQSPPGTQFAGHGVMSLQNDVLFISRANLETRRGSLAGYDINSGKQVCEYQVTPAGIHQAAMLPDGQLLVASGGFLPKSYTDPKGSQQGVRVEASSVIRVDPKNGRVLDKSFIADEGQGITHLAILGNGTIIALTNSGTMNRGGTVYISQGGTAPLKEIDWPQDIKQRLKFEMLSVAADETDHVAAATNPASALVVFFDTQDSRFLGRAERVARGIAFDPSMRRFICSGDGLFLLDDGAAPQDGLFPVTAWPLEEAASYTVHSLLVPEIKYA